MMKESKIPEPFVPKTAVEKFVHAGDSLGLTDYLARLTEMQRLAENPGVRKLYKVMHEISWAKPEESAWRSMPSMQQKNALHTAVYVCGSPEEMAEDRLGFYHHPSKLVELWKHIPRFDIQDYADHAIARSSHAFRKLQALFKEGLIARPIHENYVLGLFSLSVDRPTPRVSTSNMPGCPVTTNVDFEAPLSIRELIEQDPEFAHTTLLRLFEIEGNSEASLANCDKYGKGITSPRNTMQGLFLDLMQEGVFSRSLLLDKTLNALERDWLQFRSGWFSRFHEMLAPSVVELRNHRDRYLGLCHSRIPPTVTLALGALQELAKHETLPSEQLIVALTPVMNSKVKAQIMAALKLLDAMVKTTPTAAKFAAKLAIHALICDASDVQKQAIQRLTQWDVNEEAKDLLRQILPMVAATHRDAIQSMLANDSDDALKDVSDATIINNASLPEPRPPLSPLDSSRRLLPITHLDELIDNLAYSLEHGADADVFERVTEALVRMGSEAAANVKRFDPVLKRARKLCSNNGQVHSSAKPLPRELSRLLLAILAKERIAPTYSFAKGQFTADAFLCHRIDELMEFASHDSVLPPLAAPTHQLGYLNPEVLVERVAAEQATAIVSPRQEQILSLLRLVPVHDQQLIARARQLDPTPYVLALRYALGDEVDIGNEARLFVAAARIRYPAQDDPVLVLRYGDCGPDTCHHAQYRFWVTITKNGSWTFHHGNVEATPHLKVSNPDFLASLRHLPNSDGNKVWYSRSPFGSNDEGLLHMVASVLPSDTGAYFAEGARRLSNNLDWSEAEWSNRVYLSTLLDPTVVFSDMAILCLACGLAGKEPGQTALAVDALLKAWLEGRLQANSLALTLRKGIAHNIFKAARIYKSFSNAARMHELAPWLIFHILCDLLCFDVSDLPKDTSSLLDLLLEVRLLTRQPLPEITRQHIAAMRMTGKGKIAQKSLLGN